MLLSLFWLVGCRVLVDTGEARFRGFSPREAWGRRVCARVRGRTSRLSYLPPGAVPPEVQVPNCFLVDIPPFCWRWPGWEAFSTGLSVPYLRPTLSRARSYLCPSQRDTRTCLLFPHLPACSGKGRNTKNAKERERVTDDRAVREIPGAGLERGGFQVCVCIQGVDRLWLGRGEHSGPCPEVDAQLSER